MERRYASPDRPFQDDLLPENVAEYGDFFSQGGKKRPEPSASRTAAPGAVRPAGAPAPVAAVPVPAEELPDEPPLEELPAADVPDLSWTEAALEEPPAEELAAAGAPRAATESVSVADFFAPPAENAAVLHDQLQMDKLALEMEKKEIKRLQQKQKEDELAKKQQAAAERVRHPIGAKLIGIISVIVVVALLGVTYIVSLFTTRDVRTSAEENNLVINSRTVSACENSINGAIASASLFLDLLRLSGGDGSVQELFFRHNPEIVSIYLPGSQQLFSAEAFLAAHDVDPAAILPYMLQEDDAITRARNGSFELLNASPFFGIPLIALFCPQSLSGDDNAVVVLYSSENLGESFSSGTMNQSFLVNTAGEVLVHCDMAQMLAGRDESENPVVRQMRASTVTNNDQTIFRDADGDEYIGAFRTLSIGNGGVITTVSLDVVLEGVRATTRRNIYITVAILSLTILIIYFFSKSLSRPLKALTAVTNEINKGNFNTELFNSLGVKREDEIGVLAKSTRNEREILNMFTKLTNKGVTKAIITKEIDFEPHLKDITIFFSDIRGFTAISDGFKKHFGERSAAAIISFLNDYMSRMVTCITNTGGIVDKFEGDAIMACWGVLRNDTLEWESRGANSVTHALKKDAHDRYVKEDALSAVTCCMGMRYALMKYNKDAAEFSRAHEGQSVEEYKPYIRFGAGLNSGRATVGFMGSYDKMEFTSIGDAVNLASRTEASNKPCGTDLLITQDTYDILKLDYIRCAENGFMLRPENEDNEIVVEQIPAEFEVKGKGRQHFYGVVNMPRFDIAAFFLQSDPTFELDADCAKAAGAAGPKTLSELRALLGIPEPDFGKVDVNAEENKITLSPA